GRDLRLLELFGHALRDGGADPGSLVDLRVLRVARRRERDRHVPFALLGVRHLALLETHVGDRGRGGLLVEIRARRGRGFFLGGRLGGGGGRGRFLLFRGRVRAVWHGRQKYHGGGNAKIGANHHGGS